MLLERDQSRLFGGKTRKMLLVTLFGNIVVSNYQYNSDHLGYHCY